MLYQELGFIPSPVHTVDPIVFIGRAGMPPQAKTAELPTGVAARDAACMRAICQARDPQALRELFEIYGPKLKGWLMARGLGSGNAEDVVQDVMLKVWTRAELFNPDKASFATWVYRLTRNRWIDHQRKHGRVDVRDPELMKVIADDIIVSPEGQFEDAETAETLRRHVHDLPDKLQRMIYMAFMEHKTHQEIADETGIALGTVKTRIRSAINQLKVIMQAER